MTQHDEHDEHDENDAGSEPVAPSGDEQATPEPNVDRPQPADDAPASEEPSEVEADPDAQEDALDDLDDMGGATPTDAVADSLKEALGSMRDEADRIASLGTGEEQVAASEQFAENAGRLDEQVGAAARAADDEDR